MQTVPLDSEAVKKELRGFRDAVEACYGPLGRALALQPVCGGGGGGHFTVTSCAGKVFQLWRAGRGAVMRLVVDSLQSHTRRYHDSGLFAALLSVNLILSGLELRAPRAQVAEVTGYVLSLLEEHLNSDLCPAKQTLDLTSVSQLMAVVRTVLRTKSATCGMSVLELDHLSSLLLQAFLNLVPSPGEEGRRTGFNSLLDQFHVHALLGRSLASSQWLRGLLVESRGAVSDTLEQWREVRRNEEGNIVTALFNISLAGDSKEFPTGLQLEMEESSGGEDASLEEAVLQQMLSMAGYLVEQGVGFLGCQKCIHPVVKEFLRTHGVVAVERLSAFNVGAVRAVTGGEFISSLSLECPRSCLGELRDIEPTTIDHKSFLVLHGTRGPHSTLLLCCESETVADDLKPLATGVVSILEQYLHHPFFLCGGGCTETILSNYLEQNVTASEDILSELITSKKTFAATVKSVAASLRRVALSLEHHGGLVLRDSSFHHCWSFPPYEYFEALRLTLSREEECLALSAICHEGGKTCNCGAVSLSQLPMDCVWEGMRESVIVPEGLYLGGETKKGGGKMKENTRRSSKQPSNNVDTYTDVCVCDPYEAKLAALCLAGDIASTILRVGLTSVHVDAL